MVGPFLPDAEKLAAIRELLPATSAGIHLATAEAGPLPAETARAMAEVAEWELRTGRAHDAARDEAAGRLDEARGALAAILHGDVDSVAVAHSAAEALAAVVGAAGWRRVAWSRELDPTVQARLTLFPGAMGAVDAWSIPPGADAVVVPHVTAVGVVAPLAALEHGARAADAALLVDGSLAAGAIPVDVESLGADAYATDAHRWLLGPMGMAAVHVRDAARAGAVRAALEGSAVHRPSVVGMARSAGWLAMYVGVDWITDRTVALARRLADRLAAAGGVEVVTPVPPGAGIVAFRLTRWEGADDARAELERRAFALLAAGADGAIRASVGAWNTDEELDRFAESVAFVAAHAPGTLPRRPALTILHEPRP